MKIVLLTTQTTHHTFFLGQLIKAFPVEIVISEDSSVIPAFPVSHPFEEERERYERRMFFGGDDLLLEDFADVIKVNSVNDDESISMLRDISPDVIVVFGTGKLSQYVIDVCPNGIINLHGGDPEEYRGVDTHLWAIYHNDFRALIASIHRVNSELDDGEIILKQPVHVFKGMRLHALRAENTKTCVSLSLAALDMYKRYGHFISHNQRTIGRYYSFMPSPLKEICCKKFERFTSKL